MVYKEEVRDLFTVPQGYMLAYCISADFNLFSGIEKQFCERYDMENRLFYLSGDIDCDSISKINFNIIKYLSICCYRCYI